MSEPYRLTPVTVVLDAYRRGIIAIGHAIATATPVVRQVVRREAKNLKRLARPSPEVVPSLISERLKAAKR
jgi:hypothetical protein